MKDDSRFLEFALTAIGLMVTALLGYGQYQISKQQTAMAIKQQAAEDRRSADSIEIQTMNLVAGHLDNLSKPGSDFDASQKVVIAASEYLSSQFGRTALAAMDARISEGNTRQSEDARTRLQEASVVVPVTARWFAVLMSLPATNESSARTAANQIQKTLNAQGVRYVAQIYRTKISNNFAVVLGGPSERKEAFEAVRFARQEKLRKELKDDILQDLPALTGQQSTV